jgi:hypothetical protein
MKLDMSEEAVKRRLEQGRMLNKVCLSLANTSIGREIAEKFPDNEIVKRTSMALGRVLPEKKEE